MILVSYRYVLDITALYEVTRPLSNNLKGGYHISCPFGYVGRGRNRVVTHGLNLPRHGTETARRICGFYPVRGAGQSRPSRASGSNDRPQHKANGAAT